MAETLLEQLSKPGLPLFRRLGLFECPYRLLALVLGRCLVCYTLEARPRLLLIVLLAIEVGDKSMSHFRFAACGNLLRATSDHPVESRLPLHVAFNGTAAANEGYLSL